MTKESIEPDSNANYICWTYPIGVFKIVMVNVSKAVIEKEDNIPG